MVLVIPSACAGIAYYGYHRHRSGTDIPRYSAFFKLLGYTADRYTDGIWSLMLYLEGSRLWIYALLFSFGSHALSVMVGLLFIIKWRTGSNLYVRGYANQYDKLVMFLAVTAGFYGAAEMVSSHLSHLNALSLQIQREDMSMIQNLRILNCIFLESLPCFVIQILYLQSLRSFDLNGNNITLITMTFSVLSILFGALTVIQRASSKCINLQRAQNGRTISMKFYLKEKETGIIKGYHVHTRYLLQRSLSLSLELEMNQVYIAKIGKVGAGIVVNGTLEYVDAEHAELIVAHLGDANSELFRDLQNECLKQLRLDGNGAVSLVMLKCVEEETEIVDVGTTTILHQAVVSETQ